jgi:hypothetical protein
MDPPSLNAIILIAIRDGSVNGAELQKWYNLHVLMVLSIGGIVNAMLLPATFISKKFENSVYYKPYFTIVRLYTRLIC